MRVFSKFSITTYLLLAVLLLGVVSTSRKPAYGGSKPPISILLLHDGRVKEVDATVKDRLNDAGIGVVIRPLGKPLSPEILGLFPVVVLPDFDGLKPPNFAVGKSLRGYYAKKRNLNLVLDYVKEGGGLFFSPSMRGGGQQTARGCAAILEPIGARIIAAQIRDDRRRTVDGQYAWTNNVIDSPVSQDVERLVYPTNLLRWDDAYATVPLVTEDPAWQPVIRGMPGSVAARGLNDKWFPIDGHAEPVMAAVRRYGNGRVALLTLNPAYTFEKGFSTVKRGWLGEANVGPVNGIFLERGDETGDSDGMRVIRNMLQWLSASGEDQDFGGYTKAKLAELPEPEQPNVPGWLKGWNSGEASAQKVLIGARSAYSSGEGTVRDYAKAARKAGCAVLVMTETFEEMSADDWPRLMRDCRQASSDDLVVLPGLDIADVYQNRYILFGQPTFPQPFMLNDAGDALQELQYLAHGFGTHFAAIHRPSTTPMVHQLYKFFQGIVVYTYRDGKLVDDGRVAYEWQANNTSLPVPLCVHETRSPEYVEQAATTGHQLYVWADTPKNAAWYMRPGGQHFWESPSHFLVTSGPMITGIGRQSLLNRTVTVESDAPIVDVQLRNHRFAERRWRPGTPRAELEYHLPWSHQRWNILWVRDAKGRTAISPPMVFGPTQRYTWRCSDRQNFFGFAYRYPGTRQKGAIVPSWGTDEGRGTWPHGGDPLLGENLAPLLEFPYASPEVYITDVILDQRYWRANWSDVGYDAGSQQGTTRSRVYQGRVRYLDFKKDKEHITRDRTWMVRDWWLRLRTPVVPDGPVFPGLGSVGRNPQYGYRDPESGEYVTGQLKQGYRDLPPGAWTGRQGGNVLVALSDGLHVSANGRVGPAAGENAAGPLPVGTQWRARYVMVPYERVETVRAYMGFGKTVPYEIRLSRGQMHGPALIATMSATNSGVAGTVKPATEFPLPYPLPVVVEGLNPNWEAGVWREGGELDRIGVFERKGRAELDVTSGGRFYAGSLVTAPDPRLRLSIAGWKSDSIGIVVNNPTTSDVTTTVRTPAEIEGKYRLHSKISVPAGTNVKLTFPEKKE